MELCFGAIFHRVRLCDKIVYYLVLISWLNCSHISRLDERRAVRSSLHLFCDFLIWFVRTCLDIEWYTIESTATMVVVVGGMRHTTQSLFFLSVFWKITYLLAWLVWYTSILFYFTFFLHILVDLELKSQTTNIEMDWFNVWGRLIIIIW